MNDPKLVERFARAIARRLEQDPDAKIYCGLPMMATNDRVPSYYVPGESQIVSLWKIYIPHADAAIDEASKLSLDETSRTQMKPFGG